MTTFFVDADLSGAGEFVEATVSLATEYTLPAGTIARVRSWFPALAGATPLWRIYNSTGTLLASGGFDTAVTDAWNWGTISGGLAVSAGTYRVVIVVTRYKALGGFFSGGPITRGSITGNRGLFDSGDVAPTQVSTASYFADLDFTASGGDVAVADPVAGGGGTGGTADGVALGGVSGGGGTAGAADGLALGGAVGGGGTGGAPDGLAVGGGSGGGGSGGTADGLALGSGSGGAGTGGTPDTLLTDTSVPDPVAGGVGTGGTPDTVTNGPTVVHDQMVMPLALKARDCLVTEVGKLANPPIKVQIRPGASFAALVDSARDECCSGVAYVRTGVRQPTTNNWPTPLSTVDGPSASRGRPALYAVTLELGIYRCLPTISNIPDTNDDFPTDDQWLQASQDQADDGAALLRAVCCLQAEYGVDAVLAGPVTPLENEGPCSGIRVNVQLRAPACDCVE